jgi:6-pyruvoyl-tetrahydropterin synthase
MKWIISKSFQVDLAHRVSTQCLPNDMVCKCKVIHGHTVRIIPKIKGVLHPTTRMVVDYSLLRDFKTILDKFFDHVLILPKHEQISIYSESNEYEIYRWKNEPLKGLIALVRTGGIVHVEIPSTTAEDMSFFLTLLLADTILALRNIYEFIQYDSLAFNVEFQETPNSSCMLDKFYTFKELVEVYHELTR